MLNNAATEMRSFFSFGLAPHYKKTKRKISDMCVMVNHSLDFKDLEDRKPEMHTRVTDWSGTNTGTGYQHGFYISDTTPSDLSRIRSDYQDLMESLRRPAEPTNEKHWCDLAAALGVSSQNA